MADHHETSAAMESMVDDDMEDVLPTGDVATEEYDARYLTRYDSQSDDAEGDAHNYVQDGDHDMERADLSDGDTTTSGVGYTSRDSFDNQPIVELETLRNAHSIDGDRTPSTNSRSPSVSAADNNDQDDQGSDVDAELREENRQLEAVDDISSDSSDDASISSGDEASVKPVSQPNPPPSSEPQPSVSGSESEGQVSGSPSSSRKKSKKSKKSKNKKAGEKAFRPTNPLDSIPMMSAPNRPFSSIGKACKFFGCSKADLTEFCYTALLSPFTELQVDLANAVPETTKSNWASIRGILTTEQKKQNASWMRRRSPDTSSWTSTMFIARFVNDLRDRLFEDEDAKFRDLGTPPSMRNDRAFALYTAFVGLQTGAEKRAAKKMGAPGTESAKATPKKKPRAAKKDGSALSEELVHDEDEHGSSPNGPDPHDVSSPSGPEPQALPTPGPAASKAKPNTPKIKTRRGILNAQKPKPTSNATLIEQLKRDQPLHPEDGEISKEVTAAHWRKLKGDDVDLNPLKHWFIRDGEETRLIGAGHLIGIDRHRKVDFKDNLEYDRKNCSPSVLGSLISADVDAVNQPEDDEPTVMDETVTVSTEVPAAGPTVNPAGEPVVRAETPPPPSRVGRRSRLKGPTRLDPSKPVPESNKAKPGVSLPTPTNAALTEAERKERNDAAYERWRLLTSLCGYRNELGQDILQESGVIVDGLFEIADELQADGAATVDRRDMKSGNPKRDTPESILPVDLNDSEFRARQREFLSHTARDETSKRVYRHSLSDLHVARRSKPILPGQSDGSLMWNQTTFAAKACKAARKRLVEGKGAKGLMNGDDTGMGKTLAGAATILNVSARPDRLSSRKVQVYCTDFGKNLNFPGGACTWLFGVGADWF